jgi:predicted O-methyltransferase YrrM
MEQNKLVANVIADLYQDAKHDHLKMVKGVVKSAFRPIKPTDFKDVYLSISREQGEDLKTLIVEKQLKHVVEFGTSFGISTLFLAQGVRQTGGRIITTELIESKGQKALENFRKAGVEDLIQVRIGDAVQTLQGHSSPIDLLLLDGWKDLYLSIFQMLEPNFHTNTIIYVDNADMAASRTFLHTVAQNPKYHFESQYDGKVVLITVKA